jgi:hypothetical protein
MADKHPPQKPSDDPNWLPPHLQKLVDLLPLNTPVHQLVLFESYGGKPEYARRLRKIISEYGWDIERLRGKSGANDDYYIRRSEGAVRPRQIRYEVKPAMRKEIYKRDDWECQMCGADVGEDQELTQPQCDHKIPSERGGSSKDENLQTLCTRCNLKKRQACKHCKLKTCLGCPYAFPEQFADTIIVQLTKDAAESLKLVSERDGVPPNVLIVRMLEKLN